MQNTSWFELAIIGFILFGIGFVVWRGGAANPVGTGRLQHDVSNVRQKVQAIERSLQTIDPASKEDVERMGATLREEKARIDGVFERIDDLGDQVSGIREAMGTRHAVIDALSESVRVLTADLKAYQGALNERFTELERFVERSASTQQTVASLAERQSTIADQVARTEAQTEAIAVQVNRLYDFLTQKALK